MNLQVSQESTTAIVTLNRPERRNALSLELMQDLIAALEEIGRNREVRAVILAASGKVFCSGHDLGQMTGRDINEYRRIFDVCSELSRRAIDSAAGDRRSAGDRDAAGCQLVRPAIWPSPRGGRCHPGVKIGLLRTTMVALTRAIGRKRAMQMLLTGELVPTASPPSGTDQSGGPGCRIEIRHTPSCRTGGRSEFAGGSARQAGIIRRSIWIS
jgi:hypothetical protein